MNVLLIEDEHNVASFIKKGIEESGYHVTVAYDGETGLSLLRQNDFQVIVLDVILPQMNGWEVCRRIRRDLSLTTPVLMLTALSSTDDVVQGLDGGADDYLAKPFKFKELMARLRALERRGQSRLVSQNFLRYGDIEMNNDEKTVSRQGRNVKLTSREYTLLEYFLKNPARVLSRTELLENVWSVNFDLGTNVVDVYVNYLRNKVDKEFEPKLIHTVVGMGYILKDNG